MNLLFIYVGAVIAAGAGLLVSFAPVAYPPTALTATLVAAMLVVSYFKLRLPLAHGHSTISMAFAVDFVALLTVGAHVAMIIAALGVLVQCFVRVRRNQPLYRAAFSVATVVISVQTAGYLSTALGGGITGFGVAATIVPLAVMTVAYFAVDAGLVAGAIALSSGLSPERDAQPFIATAPGYVLAATIAMAVTVMLRQQDYTLLPFAVAPIVACHFTFDALFRRMAARVGGSPHIRPV